MVVVMLDRLTYVVSLVQADTSAVVLPLTGVMIAVVVFALVVVVVLVVIEDVVTSGCCCYRMLL